MYGGKIGSCKGKKMKEWELYDIEKDRTEWNNVAAEYPDVLKKMVRKWEEWANECYIFPKRLNLNHRFQQSLVVLSPFACTF